MISKTLDHFFHDNLWMIDEHEYRWFQNKDNEVVPTPVLNGKISHDDYVKRCDDFLNKAEKTLDKQTLHELATVFKTADIDLGSEHVNNRWKGYLTVNEYWGERKPYDPDLFDMQIRRDRNSNAEPEITKNIIGFSNYNESDKVYMIVGQQQTGPYSKPKNFYYSTIKGNWCAQETDGTQYDTQSEAEEDLWDAENSFIDLYSGKKGWYEYELAVDIVPCKPRKQDHRNLNKEENMNIYEQLNKINDTESLSEKYNVKNLKELKKLKESSDLHTFELTKEDLLTLLKQCKKTIDGTLVIKNDAVRYTSYEDDFSSYATIDNLLNNINNDTDITKDDLLEDPTLVMDYFEETIGAHSHFDVPAYKENKVALNQRYFGTSPKTVFDGSWMKSDVEFRNVDHPTWIYKITGPRYPQETHYPVRTSTDYVWYNKATPATKMQFLPEHNTACRAAVFDKLMRQGKLEVL